MPKDAQFHFFHRIFPQRIEFADIIKFTREEAFIIHVKDGFNHAMRALSMQVDLSVRQYKSFKAGEGSQYIHNLYKTAETKNFNGSFTSAFPQYEAFKGKLLNSDVTYVMAIHTDDIPLNDTKSITALYCLEQTRQTCLRRGVKLQLVII